ncbi:hypothetical protein D3C86_2076450 [compost metagenome]
MLVAVHGEGFASEDLDLVIVFTGLRGKMNDLAGKATFGFGEGRNVFKFGRNGLGGQADQQCSRGGKGR